MLWGALSCWHQGLTPPRLPSCAAGSWPDRDSDTAKGCEHGLRVEPKPPSYGRGRTPFAIQGSGVRDIRFAYPADGFHTTRCEMRADGLPRDAKLPGHISDVADFEVTRDQLIYLGRTELTGRSGSRRRLPRSPGLRSFQYEFGRRATVAMFGVSVQQVHHAGRPVAHEDSCPTGRLFSVAGRRESASRARVGPIRRWEVAAHSRPLVGGTNSLTFRIFPKYRGHERSSS